MRIAFCADVHIGNHKLMGGELIAGINDRCWDAIKALGRAIDAAVEDHGCKNLFIVGDLFDGLNVPPQVVAHVQDLFASERRDSGFKTTILVGNHEHGSTLYGDHSLAPLRPVACVLEAPTLYANEDFAIGCIPCIPRPASDWFEEEVDKLLSKPIYTRSNSRLLCFHLGIEDEETALYLRGAKDSIHIDRVRVVVKKYDIQAVFAGNWHNQKVWDNKIFQLGALAPTGFDNAGLNGYAGLAIFDTISGITKLVEVPGPRFLPFKVIEGAQETIRQGYLQDNRIYAKWVCNPKNKTDIQQFAKQEQESGYLYRFSILPDKSAQLEVARTAAIKVQQASNFKEAISLYVNELEIDPIIDKQNLISKIEIYLMG